jgi:pilus assembly protein Flp/PilA
MRITKIYGESGDVMDNCREPEKHLLTGTRYSCSVTGSELMSTSLMRFLKNDNGATAIEYGLIAAGISVAIIAAVNGLGTSLNAGFQSVSTQLK